jgi:hypothetical protein
VEIEKCNGKDSSEYKRRHSALKKLHWREFLNDFHQKNLQPNVPQSLKPSSKAAIPLSIETLGDLRDARTLAAVARRYLPTWSLIKDACASSTHSIRSEPHVLKALITMCCIKPKDLVVYYPGEAPQHKDGEECHLCGKHVQR